MHTRSTALIAYCDAETGARRSRRIARHLAKCERCRDQLRRIKREKEELSAVATVPAIDGLRSLAGILSAIATWQGSRTCAAASELKHRLQLRIETYFGAPAVLVLERPDTRPEELLGRTSEILVAFLGSSAADAVRDDVLSGLGFAASAEETCR